MDPLSDFEIRAIEATATNDPQREIILAQLERASVVSRDYTGIGLYTKLSIPIDSPKLDQARWRIQDMPQGYATHPDLPVGAGLILWLKDGYISCLESYAFEGDWPRDESLLRLAT